MADYTTTAPKDGGATEQTNVKVMVRIRPFNSREIGLTEGGIEKIRSVILMEGTTVRLLDHENEYKEREAFEFDYAFWSIPDKQNQYSPNPFAGQEDVFNVTGRPAVLNAIRGFHNTIFAYGQTGSGKTHTMLGFSEDEGIAPKVVRFLFEEIAQTKHMHPSERPTFRVELSFIEIYNEKAKDLLAVAEKGAVRSNQGKSEYAECRVRYHPEKGTFIDGLKRIQIDSEEQCLTSIKDGMEHRAQAATNMNDTSSRSHAIFQICVTQKVPAKGSSRLSIINLVDLAGSERISLSGVSGSALTEAKNINLSLSTLRRVIDILIDNSKLKKGQRPAVPPFREALLTWVLSDSLGGNSKTMMIAAISPFWGNTEDTIGTLRYALKAKAIVCNARVNEEKAAVVANQLRTEADDVRHNILTKIQADEETFENLGKSIEAAEAKMASLNRSNEEYEQNQGKYEEEVRQKSVKLLNSQSELERLRDIESVQREREEQLRKAKHATGEARKQLGRLNEERLGKDRRLDALFEKKRGIQEDHNKASNEEASAKLNAEQSRLRSLSSAFRNAFIIDRQKTVLHELQGEHKKLSEEVLALENGKRTIDKKLTQVAGEKGTYRRKIELAQKKAASAFSDIQMTLSHRESRVAEARKAREDAFLDLTATQRDVAQKNSALDNVREEHDVEKLGLEKKLTVLELHANKLDAALDRESEHKKLLDSRERASAIEYDVLKAEHSEASDALAEVLQENKAREKRLADLDAHKERLLAKRQQTKVRTERYSTDFEHNLEVLDELTKDVDELTRQHTQLRTYVDSRFFRLPQYSQVEDNTYAVADEDYGTRKEATVRPWY